MTALFELVIFIVGIYFIGALFFRVCKEGDYDDYD